MTDLIAIVLAAGQGTRMKSARPKVLHEVCGRPMVAWSVQTALDAGASSVIAVLGHGRELVEQSLAARFGDRVKIAVQAQQRGTGDAVRSGLESVDARDGTVLVLYGDTPLLRSSALQKLVESRGNAPLAMLVSTVAEPPAYGRIIRDDDGNVIAIREHRDCTEAERAIREVNPGMYAFDLAFLRRAIASLDTNNAQGELYLTDVVARGAKEATVVDIAWDMSELHGVNDRVDLAAAESAMRARILREHMLAGVTVRDPASTYVDADVVIASDVVLGPGVVLRGKTRIASGVRIDAGCVLDDVTVAGDAVLKPYSVAAESAIGERCQIGPFAHIRPASDLGPDVHVGNFVETKKTTLGARTKANHLAYLGDGVIGEDVNVGAGTIFCNYDGYKKHTTHLEDGSFIGSDSQLVAPVRVGKGAYVATGTTVTKDVPDDALAIARPKQENKLGYASRLRGKLKGR